MTLSRQLARPMLSSIFFVGPVTTLMNSSGAAKAAEPVTAPIIGAAQRAGIPVRHDPETLVRINAGVQLAAATALATGRCPRLAASVLAVSLVPTTLAGHAFWRETDPAERRRQKIELAKNASLLGGLLIAAMDTEGKPGKAWLAKAAAKRMSHEADHAAAIAKLETRVAALQAAGKGDVLAETLAAAGAGLAARTHQAADKASEAASELASRAGAVAADRGPELAHKASEKASELTTRASALAADRGPELAQRASAKASDLAGQLDDQTADRRKAARKRLKAEAKQARKSATKARGRAAKRANTWGDNAHDLLQQGAEKARDLGHEAQARLA